MIKYLPDNVLKIMGGKNNIKENIIYNNEHFIVLEDIKHNKDSYHYRNNIRI